ncbi:bZIP transcription factor 1-B isoform X2 [Elaeis guineensis]|uniref:BZIP transcription factor 16 isoform X2 n=2 Tax=Elaeis guineensis var. tenera TaxID=51953 RepID=A0A6I9SBX9_ELAGV|nr:bZIP transcription factor 16 isoform X2 [Elaeis guineensis]
MGSGEVNTPTKTQKPTFTQEQPPSSPAMVYPDWASFQFLLTYRHIIMLLEQVLCLLRGFSILMWHRVHKGAHICGVHRYLLLLLFAIIFIIYNLVLGGCCNDACLSLQRTGFSSKKKGQIISPYRTPPFVSMYPHGGIYPHPSIPPGSYQYSPYPMPSTNGIAEASVAGASGTETDGKVNKTGKASSGSANGVFSQSGESGSEGSSEGSDANSQNGSRLKHGSEHGSGDEEAQKGRTGQTTSNEVTQTLSTPIVLNPTVPFVTIPPGGLVGPTTTLNIGMDYWGGSASVSAVRGKVPSAPSTAPFVPSRLAGSRDKVPPDPSIQDERELKRQKRKQSNRESARRSRLRKQAECEELANRVVTQKEENNSLKEELKRMRGECDKLTSENATLAEKLGKHLGDESRSDEQVDSVNGDG